MARSPRLLADELTKGCNRVLIEHCGSEQPINVKSKWHNATLSLIEKGLLRVDTQGTPWITPRKTQLTDVGREVAAVVLGRYADAIVRARRDASLWALVETRRYDDGSTDGDDRHVPERNWRDKVDEPAE